MEAEEKIKVWVKVENGKVVCICKRPEKRCGKHCEAEVVIRDRFQGWEGIFRRDRYGNSK